MKIANLKPIEKFKTYSGEMFQILPTFILFCNQDGKTKKYREILRLSNNKKYLEIDFEKTNIEKI